MSAATKDTIESKNWYKDRYQYVLVQRKLMALFTVLALICALGALTVVAWLTPLKTVEPFVIQVDPKSGITQTVDPMTVRQLTANEAVNNFFIVQYIRSREAYNVYDLTKNYDNVRIMSDSKKVYPSFVIQADPNNPSSNAARLGATGVRIVKFKSITYLNPQTVQARLLIEERTDRDNYTQQHMIALVAFEYVKMSLTAEERYTNPLGFRVTEYKLVEENLQR